MKKQEYLDLKKKHQSTKEAIPAVLDMAYGDESIGYIVLD